MDCFHTGYRLSVFIPFPFGLDFVLSRYTPEDPETRGMGLTQSRFVGHYIHRVYWKFVLFNCWSCWGFGGTNDHLSPESLGQFGTNLSASTV